jgi:hypothetical protein
MCAGNLSTFSNAKLGLAVPPLPTSVIWVIGRNLCARFSDSCFPSSHLLFFYKWTNVSNWTMVMHRRPGTEFLLEIQKYQDHKRSRLSLISSIFFAWTFTVLGKERLAMEINKRTGFIFPITRKCLQKRVLFLGGITGSMSENHNIDGDRRTRFAIDENSNFSRPGFIVTSFCKYKPKTIKPAYQIKKSH